MLSLILFSTIIYGQTLIRLNQIEPIQGTVIKSQGETASKVLTTNGSGGSSWQPQLDMANITITHEITQTNHALSVGNAIYLNNSYYKAKADTLITSDVVGIVTEVKTVNVFVYASSGTISGSYTKGENYFLSNSVAGAVIPEPTYNKYDVRQFIGTGLDGGKLLLEIDLGFEIQVITSAGSEAGYPPQGIPVSTGEVWAASLTGTANQLLRRNPGNTAYEFFTPAYITGYTENDPVFGIHTVKNIADGTGFLKNNGAGTWSYINATYLTAETDPTFGTHTAKNIANGTGFLKNNGAGTWSYINENYLTAEVDGSISNEIQDASGSGSDLSGFTIALSSDATPIVLPNEADPIFVTHTAKNIANGTGFLKNNGAGTWSYINATYLTAETDPVFVSHTAKNIANGTGFLKNNGSGTWSYIDATYLTAETDPVFVSHTAKNIANGTGFLKNNGSGTWSYINATYLTTETDPVFAAHTSENIANGTGFLKNNGSGTWSYNIVQNGTKTADWTHNAATGDIGAYRVNLAASTISIHNLSDGLQGTIFLNFVTTTPTAITVNTFSDAGTNGLTEIVIGAAVGFTINKSTSITYTCANDGTNTYVYLVYGKE